jgi:flagellar export protein FliJ
MKTFRFPLQSLRVLREQKEHAAQKRFADALRLCEDAAAQVKAAGEELSACWGTLGRELSSGVAAIDLLRTRAWCNVLELRLKERASLLEKARHTVDTMWNEMMLATRDREALERYHSKKRRAYDRKARAEEQKALDELAVRLADAPMPLNYPNPARARCP